VNVETGRSISSAISATFSDESTPPESNTPNGTSDTIRRAIDCLSRRVSSATASGSLRSRSVSVDERLGTQSQYWRAFACPP